MPTLSIAQESVEKQLLIVVHFQNMCRYLCKDEKENAWNSKNEVGGV
jgi:hypothetical protein